MKTRLIIAFLVILLASCASGVTPVPTAISPTLIPTSTFIPASLTLSPALNASLLPGATASLQPTIAGVMTPDAVQVEKWKEYEIALAKAVFNVEVPKDVLCEWVILGQSGQEVYVWVVCRDQYGGGSLPAVIYLESSGSIQNIKTPKSIQKDYLDAIHKLFPEDVRKKFGYYESGGVEELLKHLEMRREHPEEPPLIVLNAVPAP